jgi:hypothetical protein
MSDTTSQSGKLALIIVLLCHKILGFPSISSSSLRDEEAFHIAHKNLVNDKDFSSPYTIKFPRKLKDFVTQQQ